MSGPMFNPLHFQATSTTRAPRETKMHRNLIFAAALLSTTTHIVNATEFQTRASEKRAAPPTKESDTANPKGATEKNQERGPKTTYEVIINCAGLIEVINVARMRNPQSEILGDVGIDSTNSRHRAWDAMIAASPELRSLPTREAEHKRAALLNTHMDKTIWPYLDNLPKLVKDYRRCQALQILD